LSAVIGCYYDCRECVSNFASLEVVTLFQGNRSAQSLQYKVPLSEPIRQQGSLLNERLICACNVQRKFWSDLADWS